MTIHHIRNGATTWLILVALITLPIVSVAEEEGEEEAATGAAALGTNPASVTYSGSDSSDGAPPLTIRTSTQSWEFGFHGYLRAPMRASFDKYEVRRFQRDADNNVIRDPNDDTVILTENTGDEDWRFRMPMATPDNTYTDWKYTNNMGGPWTEMIFSYGNSIAVGNVSVSTWNITDGGWRNLQSQLGIDQAFVTLNFPRAFGKIGGLTWNVGVFANRYGGAGRYDAGRYDTYIFGRTHIAGETLTAKFDLAEKLTLFLEHGFGAKTDVLQLDPKQDLQAGSPAANSNAYAWVPYAGQNGQLPAFVNHGHAGLLIHTHRLWKELWINAHIMHAFTNSADKNEDALSAFQGDDGKYLIAGGEIKANGAIFGDAYLGFSTVATENIARMPDAIELLHSQGGWNLLKNFYGDMTFRDPGPGGNAAEPNAGTGRINTLAWQYMFSLSRLLWNLQEKEFWGQGPDLQISTWGMFNTIDVDNEIEPFLKRYAKKKLKVGGEVFYTPLKYVGFGVRFDRVMPDLDYDPSESATALNDGDGQFGDKVPSYAPFSILTPKLRFKTAFVTHEEVNISYSRYFWDDEGRDYDYSLAAVRAENPYEGQRADRNAFMISVNMWW